MTEASDIRIEDIRRSLGGRAVLRGVSLTLHPGRHHLLLGENGAGKTTLARILAGIDAADGGELPDALATLRPALLQQDFVVFPQLSVLENALLGVPGHGRAAKDAAREQIARMGLAERAGERAGTLSHGQQQRLSVARALAADARLLILDETFAHSDRRSRRRGIAVIERYVQERQAAALWIAHEPAELSEIADHVAVLHDGRIVQQGSFAELYEDPVSPAAAMLTGDANLLDADDWNALCPWIERGLELCSGRRSAVSAELERNDAEESGASQLLLRPEQIEAHALPDDSPASVADAPCIVRRAHDGRAWRLRVSLPMLPEAPELRIDQQHKPPPLHAPVALRLLGDPHPLAP